MMSAGYKIHIFHQMLRALSRIASTRDLHRHQNIFESCQRRNQVKGLKHKSDLAPSNFGEFIFIHRGDRLTIDENFARSWLVETRNQPKQRRLSAARRPYHRNELAI